MNDDVRRGEYPEPRMASQLDMGTFSLTDCATSEHVGWAQRGLDERGTDREVWIIKKSHVASPTRPLIRLDIQSVGDPGEDLVKWACKQGIDPVQFRHFTLHVKGSGELKCGSAGSAT